MAKVLLSAKDIQPLKADELRLVTEFRELLYSKQQISAPKESEEFMARSAQIDDELAGRVCQDFPLEFGSRLNLLNEEPTLNMRRISLIVQSLRDLRTSSEDFRALTGQLYSSLFDFTYSHSFNSRTHTVKTRVTAPHQQYSSQEVIESTGELENMNIAVLLRGALYPALVIGKEAERVTGACPDYSLFRIRRSHADKTDLEYLLDYAHYNPAKIDGSNLVIPDPMLATGGSLIAVYRLLESEGVKPKTVTFFGAIGAFEGAIQALRHIPLLEVTLGWMDPVLNDKGYILPGLGDAGDLLNGNAENITDLLKGYGREFCRVHVNQIEKVYQSMKQPVAEEVFG